MIFMHGTSYDNAKQIMKNGFQNASIAWNCSNQNLTYLRKQNDFDEFECEQLTIESAQCTAAIQNSQETKLAVFIFDIPEDFIEDYITEDTSCENTDGCYEILNEDLNDAIQKNIITATVKIYKDAYIPYLRPFYLITLYDNPYISLQDTTLKYAIELLAKNQIYLEDIYYYGEIVKEYNINKEVKAKCHEN